MGILVVPTEGRAEALLKQLRDGWDFGVLARENSIDPSGSDGGYLGKLAPDELKPELGDAVRRLPAGQCSGIVRTATGFAIMKVFTAPPGKPGTDSQRTRDMAAAGLIRYGVEAGGMQEADAAFNQIEKPEGWNRNLQQICSIRKQSYAGAIEKLRQKLKEEEASHAEARRPLDPLRNHIALGQLYAYDGNMENAVEQYETALQIAQSAVPDGIAYFHLVLGTFYLHWSEMENGGYSAPGESDLFPPNADAARYKKTAESEKAIEHLSQYLDAKSDDYQARWMLNLAYATLGQYPKGVPQKYLIAPSAFESTENLGRFRDVAPAAGLNVFASAGAVLAEDFENNGLLDVLVSSSSFCDAVHYFHNNGDGTFTDRTSQAGLADQLGGLNTVEGDYNNDGCMDFLILRGGWQFPMRKSLLRNNCNGTFTDVTDASGLGATVTSTQSAAWADIDNDGNLDLFLVAENAPSQLFRNRGDGTFEDISHAAGIDKTAFSKGVTTADYDNDGYMDFYVSNFNEPNLLYRNNHDNTFTEIASQAGVREPMHSFATWFFDYDNDGWPDLYVTGYFNSMDESIRSYLHMPVHVERQKLYRNMHNGTFEDVSERAGIDRVLVPMGSNFEDIDNDGYPDIYLGMGNPSLGSLLPHILLHNEAGQKFVDITASSGTGELHKGHGVTFADMRRNGQLDILAEVGGAIPSDKHVLRVFQNPGNRNDWLNVRLIGVKSNRSAVGARIEARVQDGQGHTRSIWRTVGETSSFGSHPLEQHIGLGAGARDVAVNIWWPATSTRQHFEHVGKNQFVEIKEFADSYRHLDRKPLATLGAAR